MTPPLPPVLHSISTMKLVNMMFLENVDTVLTCKTIFEQIVSYVANISLSLQNYKNICLSPNNMHFKRRLMMHKMYNMLILVNYIR